MYIDWSEQNIETCMRQECGIHSHSMRVMPGGAAAAGSEPSAQKKVGQLQRLRNFAAKRMRNLAEITAEHISKCAPSPALASLLPLLQRPLACLPLQLVPMACMTLQWRMQKGAVSNL